MGVGWGVYVWVWVGGVGVSVGWVCMDWVDWVVSWLFILQPEKDHVILVDPL